MTKKKARNNGLADPSARTADKIVEASSFSDC
jgi:hypothetical protein